MDDKETSCQGSNFGDFKSVNEDFWSSTILQTATLPNQKRKTSKDKVNYSRSRFANVNFK